MYAVQLFIAPHHCAFLRGQWADSTARRAHTPPRCTVIPLPPANRVNLLGIRLRKLVVLGRMSLELAPTAPEPRQLREAGGCALGELQALIGWRLSGGDMDESGELDR